MRTRPRRPALPCRAAAAATLAIAVLAGASGCGGDGDGTARDAGSEPARSSDTPSPSPGTSAPDGPGSYPAFTAEDYTYRLEVICYCPQVGAVRVEVADGEVVSARVARGGRGVQKGAEAPEFARLTINEIIDVANDSDVASVEVTWPDGQAHPSVVEVDRLANATDDEVTYTIRKVRVR